MFKLFSNIITVKGYFRSALYDLQRDDYHFISSTSALFLLNNPTFQKEECPEDLFIHMLEENYVHEIVNNERLTFPNIEFDYNSPNVIETLLIEISELNETNFSLLELVNVLKIKNILFYIKKEDEINILEKYLKEIKYSTIGNIEMIFFHSFLVDYRFLIKEPRIQKIYFYNAKNKEIKINGDTGRVEASLNYNFSERQLFTQHPNYFNVNLTLYCESNNFNVYFNKKLYIDTKGEIKNAPECEKSFGNIKDIKYSQDIIGIIETSEFQKYWNVHKEIIDVCKDCEFRHMCVDNRVPMKRKNNEWYHKSECNYNPYIAMWKGEEGYKTLSECGVKSDENGFNINHDRIATINEELWSDV